MKNLFVGNHTCGNRGDGAILRGLIDSMNAARSDLEIDVISRYPTELWVFASAGHSAGFAVFAQQQRGQTTGRHGKA